MNNRFWLPFWAYGRKHVCGLAPFLHPPFSMSSNKTMKDWERVCHPALLPIEPLIPLFPVITPWRMKRQRSHLHVMSPLPHELGFNCYELHLRPSQGTMRWLAKPGT